MEAAEAGAGITVTVACSPRAGVADEVVLALPPGATVRQALHASGLEARYPEVVAAPAGAGVWGKLCPWDTVLRDGDRVEIYRPLQIDPKEARRLRYREQRGALKAAKS